MAKITKSTNGTKPVEEIDTLDTIETLEETAMTSLVNIEDLEANYSLETPTKPRQTVNPTIKLEGLKVDLKPVNNFSQETINSLIALSESLGIDPEVAIAKILDAVLGRCVANC
jgi:hypothetical protein